MHTFLFVFLCTAHALCTPGRDGVNATVSITRDGAVCALLEVTPWAEPLRVCNGTGIELIHGQGCAQVVAGSVALAFCNGTDGPQGDPSVIPGPQGDRGAPGPPVLIEEIPGTECLNVTGEGSGVICNASNLVGTQGPSGPQGIQGIAGAVGPAGAAGILPRYTIVDGANLTRTGIQQAINNAQVPGFVYVASSVTSDCTPLVLRSGVTLDFGGQAFALPSSASNCDLMASPTISFGATIFLTANALATTASATITSASSFVVGDNVLIATASVQQLVVVASIASNTLNFRDVLVFDFTTTSSASVSRILTPLLADATLQNMKLVGNGNTGASSRLLALNGFVRLTVDNVQLWGAGGYASLSNGIDSVFKDFTADLMTGSSAAIQFVTVESSHFGNVQVRGAAGPGIEFRFCALCTGSSVHAHGTSGGGVLFTTSSSNAFDDIITTNDATGAGMTLRSNSGGNLISTFIATGNHGAGLVFNGAGDSQNQLLGVVLRGNVGNSAVFGSGANSNFVQGSADTSVVIGPNAFHQVVQINGHSARTIQTGAPATLAFNDLWVPYLIDNQHLAFATKGSDAQSIINGTSPTITSRQVAECDTLGVNGEDVLTVCNGRRGPPGTPSTVKGNKGPTGSRAVISHGNNCVRLNNVVNLCNGSTQPGPTGIQGIQGIPGIAGVQGPKGTPPAARIAVVTIPQRSAIQTAMDAVAASGGGTVYVAVTPIVSDCTALVMRTGVSLDFMGGRFLMSPTSCSYSLIYKAAGLVGFLVNNQQLNASTSRFQMSTGLAALVAPGDVCFFIHDRYETTVIQSVNYATGDVAFRSPVVNTYAAGTQFVSVFQPLRDAAVRNAVLDANGNTGASSVLLDISGAQRLTLDRVTVTGTTASYSSPSGCIGICVFYSADSVFKHLRSVSVAGDCTNGCGRDVSFTYLTTNNLRDLQSIQSSGFGPNQSTGTYTVFHSIRSHMQQARGYRSDLNVYTGLTNLISVNHQTNRGVGFFMSAFGTRLTTSRNVQALGNTQEGIGIDGDPTENYNQLFGFNSNGNANGGITVNSQPGLLSAGNYFMGATNGGIGSGSGNEGLPNCYLAQTNGNGGAEYLHVPLPLLADFPTGNSDAWLIVTGDGTNGKIVFSVRGTNGVLGHAVFTVA